MPGPNTATYLERLLTFLRTAAGTSFDPTGTDLTATDVQAAIVEVAASAFTNFLPESESSPVTLDEYPDPTDGYPVAAADMGRLIRTTGGAVTLIVSDSPDVPVGALFGVYALNGGAIRSGGGFSPVVVSSVDAANQPIYFEGAPSGWNGILLEPSETVLLRKVAQSEGTSTWAIWRVMRPARSNVFTSQDGTGTITLNWGSSVNLALSMSASTVLGGAEFPGAGTFILKVANGGAFTLDWPSFWYYGGGTAPTVTPSGIDLFKIVNDGTDVFVSVIEQDLQVPP